MYKLCLFFNSIELTNVYSHIYKSLGKDYFCPTLSDADGLILLQKSLDDSDQIELQVDNSNICEYFFKKYSVSGNCKVTKIATVVTKPIEIILIVSPKSDLDILLEIIKDFADIVSKKENTTTKDKESSLVVKDPKETEIVNAYRQVLGREPSANDLNYIKTLALPLSDLVLKMVESQEHASLLEAKSEYFQSRIELNTLKKTLEASQRELKDKNEIIESMGMLNEQKNTKIEDLKQKYDSLAILHETKFKEIEVKDKRTTWERFLDFFNKHFG